MVATFGDRSDRNYFFHTDLCFGTTSRGFFYPGSAGPVWTSLWPLSLSGKERITVV